MKICYPKISSLVWNPVYMYIAFKICIPIFQNNVTDRWLDWIFSDVAQVDVVSGMIDIIVCILLSQSSAPQMGFI